MYNTVEFHRLHAGDTKNLLEIRSNQNNDKNAFESFKFNI